MSRYNSVGELIDGPNDLGFSYKEKVCVRKFKGKDLYVAVYGLGSLQITIFNDTSVVKDFKDESKVTYSFKTDVFIEHNNYMIISYSDSNNKVFIQKYKYESK